MRKHNYLNNKDILSEIHKSKGSFCSYVEDSDHQYDLIIPLQSQHGTLEQGLSKINIRTVAEAKRNRAKRIQTQQFDVAKAAGKKVKLAEFEQNWKKIDKKDLVFRVMTYDHIPDEPGRKKTPKTIADTKTKLNFPSFQHFRFNENDELVCVGKSHWEGGMENGYFNKQHGKVTNKLAHMWMKLCERYATRGNVRGYTYNDEMRGQAILQLTQIGLQFDESKSQNPFAYYTAAVTNSFVRVINLEKRNQNIRDDILEMNDMAPSYTRQSQREWEANSR